MKPFPPRPLSIAILLFLLTVMLEAQKREARLIVTNATIHSMDKSNRLYSAMAVDGDRIVALGSTKHILAKYRAQKIIDCAGKTVLPGFIDAHAHLLGLGERRFRVDLEGTKSVDEVRARIKARVENAAPGEWIVGRGWDQNDWQSKRFPSHTDLDDVAPNNPLFLIRIDGHAAWLNLAALERAGITTHSSDTLGGKILRRADGSPTGILLDNQMEVVRWRIPPHSKERLKQMYKLALEECHRFGLTSVHDMGIDAPKIEAIRELIGSGGFPFRLFAVIDGLLPEWHDLVRKGRTVFGADQLVLGGIKLYADGALGSRGASLLEAYSDDAGNSGIEITSQEIIRNVTLEALRSKLQVAVHAIGDRANRLTLNAFEEALRETKRRNARLRIEHVQVLQQSDMSRFAKLGVLASMQPTHCTSDMYWAEARLGAKRVEGAYAWRSLHRTGAMLLGGSDFPIETANPLLGIYAAVTRRDKFGVPNSHGDIEKHFSVDGTLTDVSPRYRDGWYAREKLDRLTAIRMFTSNAAYGAFMEREIGSLEAGKYADFILLDADVMTIPAKDIPNVSVEATFVGGSEVYRKTR